MLPQKKNKKVNFTHQQEVISSTQEHTLQSSEYSNQNLILKQLHQTLAYNLIYIPAEELIFDQSQEHSAQKNIKNITKQVQLLYDSLSKLLFKELKFSLNSMIQQIFDAENENYSCDVSALKIFYYLLKLKTVTNHNCYKLLKWIYDLTIMEYSLQLSNLKSSINKKLILLGFSILDNLRSSRCLQSSSSCSSVKFLIEQSCFKQSVSSFIKQKQEQISSMKFELCRICEMPISMRFILSHSKLCEQRHQMVYNKKKLQQKGRQLISLINDLQKGSQDYQTLKGFLDKVFQIISDKIVSFALEGDQNELNKIIDKYQYLQNHKNYEETLELLRNYALLLRNNDVCDTLSDKGSKTHKSRHNIKYSSSNTSFHKEFSEFSSQTDFICEEVASEKTIAFKEDSEGTNSYHQIKFCDFQILKMIGRGSYSEVYLVRKRQTKDLYAMKVIKIQNLNEETMQALKKQQRIYRSITQGYNVKLYYSFCQNNLYFLILDFGCGGSLRNLLQQQVYFEERYIKSYLANLILAVDSIHRMGIVHRDLKPENLVINQSGQLILTDFNLSKLVKDQQPQKQGTFYGTPDYIAPQVLKQEHNDKMVDWFSVGVIAYQMVIGVTPFTDMTPEKVFQNILKGEIQWPCEQQGEGISQQCRLIISALLQSDPLKRFGSTLDRDKARDKAREDDVIGQMRKYKFFDDIDLTKTNQFQYFYVPNPPKELQQDLKLFQQIQAKKNKTAALSIETDYVVRYDILQSATKKYMKSHRNSRFKLEKELEVLKQLIPSSGNVNLKQHNSFNNLNKLGSFVKQNKPGVSCKAFLQLQTH